MRIALGLTFIVSTAFSSTSDQHGNSSADRIAEIFGAEAATGTLVVASTDGQILHVHDENRANRRFSPASTFKIPNTLIALRAAIVTSPDSPFQWDGIERGIPAWNGDQTLDTAFKVSCVWCYQQLARKIGAGKYAVALAELGYGNQQLGERVDQFWLNGELQISAYEQIAFLRKLHDYSVPYRREHVDIVKGIMLIEQTDDYSLYAKTGWTGSGLAVGWYVGFIETNENTWLFAMNMQMERVEQAPLRKQLTMWSLRAVGVL